MAAVTSLSQLDLSKTYSYADYLSWQLTEWVELIKGHIRKKSPAPRLDHARYMRRLLSRLDAALAGQRCEAFAAPVDVRLLKSAGGEQLATVVQPDLCVVCDPAKMGELSITGAPDFIIEIVSPGSVNHDTKTKFALYEENGVGEYWIVVPAEKLVLAYVLTAGRYELAGEYYEPGPMPCATLPQLGLEWNDIFQPR